MERAGLQRGDSRKAASHTGRHEPGSVQFQVDASPRVAQLHARAQRILASPRVAAQRKDITSMGEPGGEGLPAPLKSGIEALSGVSMDNVKVHRSSPKPAQRNAHAYAQGRNIYLGPGQERHLPHEAWHVVQQAQGRVRPTAQMADGAPVNDDPALEREADARGAHAARGAGPVRRVLTQPAIMPVVQGYFTRPLSRLRKGDGARATRKATVFEILDAERRLRKNGAHTLHFRELAATEQDEGDLDAYVESHLPTMAVMEGEEGAQHEAIVTDALIAAYRRDLSTENAHYLQEPEGQIIANALGVTAHIMNQIGGVLVQSNGIDYGNGGQDGYLLHINGNHYLVIYLSGEEAPDYVDMVGNGYVKGEPTVSNGNCLIDGLHLIRHNTHASQEAVARLRKLAAKTPEHGGLSDEDIEAILTEIITNMADGVAPEGIGSATRSYLDRDPILTRLFRQARQARADAQSREEDDQTSSWDAESEDHSESSSDSESYGKPSRKKPKREPAPTDAPPENVVHHGTSEQDEPDESDSHNYKLEKAVTAYVLECNRIGESEAQKTPLAKRVQTLWEGRFATAVPDHAALVKWISQREKDEHDYFGSDTDSSDGEDFAELEHGKNKAPPFTKEDEDLLAKLNGAIGNAKSAADIEAILRDKAYARFVIPQFRGIAYMTNRFSKPKRREHRKTSQVNKPVFSDAVRPDDMSREDFYTTEHARDSRVWDKARALKKWLKEKRKPDPFVDASRKVQGKPRVFPTPFHLLQSDYSQNYTKSAQIIAEYYAQENSDPKDKGKEKEQAPLEAAPSRRRKGKRTHRGQVKTVKNAARDKAYAGLPVRSHPFVSTADAPRHAVRYALGNKPIKAERGFRLRPRWRRSGKPQHPYSGKVYVSLHPLRDYLAPDAPSHVWSGRKSGALSIDNDTSKEGESSFLGLLKHNRVVLEQVIRWPSLTVGKDDGETFGLSKEERAEYRKILEKHKPHSRPQQELKSKTLGPKVEDFFTRRIEARTREEAARRNKKLIYRGLDGHFQSSPPRYVTPPQISIGKLEGAHQGGGDGAAIRTDQGR